MRNAFWIGSGLALLGCADPIAREELLARIQAGTPPPIIDVRSQAEYDEAHVPGAVHKPVAFLRGHMRAWKREGLPVETSAGEGAP